MDGVTGYGQKILVGFDGSPHAVQALDWAIHEAAALRGSVDAVYVWQIPSLAYSAPGYVPLTEPEIVDQGRRCLDDALASLPDPGDVKVGLHAAEGPPSDILAKAAEEADVAMLVVGARGHGGFAGLLLGSVTHSLTHHSTKPLVIVPSGWVPAGGSGRKIVVGIDGSDDSVRALAWAASMARVRAVPLEVVVVAAKLPAGPATQNGYHEPDGASDNPEMQKILDESLARVDTTGVVVDRVVVGGHPAKMLTELSKDAQLLVVGTRGRGRTREAVSGSVSHACTHHAAVPVAVVPHLR